MEEQQHSQQETQQQQQPDQNTSVHNESNIQHVDSNEESHLPRQEDTFVEDVPNVDSLKRRIGQQARKHEKERAEWLREREALLRRDEQAYAVDSSQDTIDLSSIKPEQFVSLVEYANQVRSNTDRQQEIHNKVRDSYHSAREKYPDIDDYASALNDLPEAPPGFAESLSLLDNADDVIYQVIKDPKEYQKLVGMRSAVAVAQRLKDISNYLASKGREVSKVNPPIKPLGASGESEHFRQKSISERRAELREQYRGRMRKINNI